jgi:phenylpropionate dioxygenase-like ring-hydroxylating dioxygenase large terminal subunit
MNIYAGKLESRDDPTVLGTDPIPAKYYYDPDWYELERKAVWMRSWLNVGHVCELPETGSFIKREIEFAKASVLITRSKDGVVRAFHNTCTHRGTQLTDEDCGKRNTFSCPYHMWTYGTDGRLISAPDFDRFYTTKEASALKPIAVEVCAGLIFICFEPQQSLPEYLGDMAPYLESLVVAQATTFHEYIYDIEANWKMTYDNFQENYHLRFVHPRSSGPGTGPENEFGYPTSFSLNGIHRTQTIWTQENPQLTAGQMLSFKRGMPRLMADGIANMPHGRDYFALFPNFFLLGATGNHFLHTVLPLGAGKSRGIIRLYWVGDDETASVRYFREAMLATTRDIHSEDVNIIEAGQRGLSGGALEYVHFQEKEILCRHLIKVVEEKVEAYQAEVAAH